MAKDEVDALLDESPQAPAAGPSRVLAAEDNPFAASSAGAAPGEPPASLSPKDSPTVGLPGAVKSNSQEGTPAVEPQVTGSVRHEDMYIGPYRIHEELGFGGMGRVYRAYDAKLDRFVAVKVMRSTVLGRDNADQFKARFRDEARIPAGINHPNIITIYDAGQDNGSDYFVMEYIPGSKSLNQLVREAADSRTWLPLDLLRDIFLQVTSSVRALHARSGTRHRDLKLDNLLLSELPGGGIVVKLIDFGIAHNPGAGLTNDGSLLGTPSYMPPEYFEAPENEAFELDHRSDLFALGIVLYSCVTLNHPYPGIATYRDAMLKHQFQVTKPLLPSCQRPGLPAGWDTVLMGLLERDRNKRYQTAAAVYADIQRIDQLGPYQGDGARLLPVAAQQPPVVGVDDLLSESSILLVDALPPDVHSGAAAQPSGVLVPPPAQGAPSPSLPSALHSPVVAQSLKSTQHQTPAGAAVNAQWAAAWAKPPDAARKRAFGKLLAAGTAALLVLAVLGGVFWKLDQMAAERQSTPAKPLAGMFPGDPKPPSEHWVDDVRKAPLFPTSDVPTPAAINSSPSAAQAPALPEAAPEAVAPYPGRARGANARNRKAQTASAPVPMAAAAGVSPTPPTAVEPANPWQALYGSGSDLNAGALVVRPDGGTDAAPSIDGKGSQVTARLADNISSSPVGAPVVVKLSKPAQVGPHKLPIGTEVHGKTAASQGLRVFVTFEFFRLPGGNTIPILGTARGRDGRQGIPGQRTLGSGAAGSVATTAGSSLVKETGQRLAAAAGDVLGSEAIRETGGAAGDKAKKLDPEEDVVLAKRNTEVVVYVEALR